MFEEYLVDLSSLDNPRKNGVSGIMRVKDDAQFITESVNSVISSLDELIICYQKSVDNTEIVIKQIKEKYKEKIQVFFYEPPIISHNLTDRDWIEIEKMTDDSVFLLSNYYNFALSKCSFKYAVKIDADQIYFPEKIKDICDLYRSESKTNINPLGILSYWYYKTFAKIGCIFPEIINRASIRIFLPNLIIKYIRIYVKQKIQNQKVIASFEGLNIYFKNNQEYICGGCFEDGVQPPIGGCGDHIFFPVCSNNYYKPKLEKKYNRAIEIMQPSSRVYFGLGFLWIHMNALRQRHYPKNYKYYKNKLLKFTEFKDIWNLNKFKIPKAMIVTVMMDYKYDYKMLNKKVQSWKSLILRLINNTNKNVYVP